VAGSRSDDDAAVAAWIARNGVTRCPTAICAETPGVEVSPEDRAAHAARGIDPLADKLRWKSAQQRFWAKKKAGAGGTAPA
jgi:hypothetical protein